MKIEQKAELPLDKKKRMHARQLGIGIEEMNDAIESVMDREDIEDEEEAFEQALRELRRTVVDFVPLTPGKEVLKENRDIPYYGFFARTYEGTGAKIRRMRFYPEDEEELEEYKELLNYGELYRTDSVIQMTRYSGEEITDNLTGEQIYGFKSAEKQDIGRSEHIDENEIDEFKTDYIEMFGIEDEQARSRVVQQKSWSDLMELIQEYETPKIGVFQTLQDVDIDQVETDEGQTLKPRLKTMGQVERRGVQGIHDIVIYFDDHTELIDFKNSHEVPFKAVARSAWIPTATDEEGNEVEIISSTTGTPRYGVKDLDVEMEHDEMLGLMKEQDFHTLIDTVVDPNSDNYIAPDPDQEGVEFQGAFKLPWIMIDATDSVVREKGNPRLNLTIFDQDVKRMISGKAYGDTAHNIVGSGDEPEFMENVEKMHGAVAKNVLCFAGRSTYEGEDGEPITNWIIYGVHDYEQLDEDDLEEFNRKLEELE